MPKNAEHSIYAEVLGCGATGDGYHITAPQPEGKGAIEAMSDAMAEAGYRRRKVSYINAHGTSTELNDLAESIAIREVFGAHAPKVPISSDQELHRPSARHAPHRTDRLCKGHRKINYPADNQSRLH